MGEVEDPRRKLRHDLRGTFNELRLCVEVLRIENDPDEILRWLEAIDVAADRCDHLVEKMAALPD